MNLYRKYRPKNFNEVVGQDIVVKTLMRSVAKNSISHAYLFSGPRGTGKTSTAKIFAKAVNCLSPIDGMPCNNCSSCKLIDSSKATDIVELDAASNRGINEIRQIRDSIKFQPVYLKYKVYIIDEAHMLTKEAFNALLKTLEEPPSYIIFILATTEPHKLPITILSRCQHFEFKRLTLPVIEERLKEIAVKENIKIEKEALTLIAEFSDGALRDAINLLDQLYSFTDNITSQDVYKLTKKLDYKYLDEILYLILNGDITGIINNLRQFYFRGFDFKQLNYMLINFLQNLIYARLDIEVDLDFLQFKSYNLNSKLKVLNSLLNTFLKLETLLKESSIPEILFQAYILEFILNMDKKEVDKNVVNSNIKNNQVKQLLDSKPVIEKEVSKKVNISKQFFSYLKKININLYNKLSQNFDSNREIYDYIKIYKLSDNEVNVEYEVQDNKTKIFLSVNLKRQEFTDRLKEFLNNYNLKIYINSRLNSLDNKSKIDKVEKKKGDFSDKKQNIFKDKLSEYGYYVAKLFEGEILNGGKGI